MTRHLCIHGHFYQPSRFDPWLDVVLPEGSAAPDHDWNTRITRECYAPVSQARRLDSQGMITELVNGYAWMSFNFGPTLLRWLERETPTVHARILEADRQSVARLGHGNALAQIYHHAIMPLATPLDKELEIGWAIQDFQTRFGRMPEGMWLAEAAVDTPTLEALAQAGIRFTILAPRQAQAICKGGESEFTSVDESNLDTTRPYLVRLPQGKSIAVFFYHAPTSQAVAFERLLENGETFWTRLSSSFSSGLQSIATDGESYGHHFMFGEMALAYVVEQARQNRDEIFLTNYAAYLAAHPPTHEVRIHENSSWSCIHGLERWKTHCGCSDGGHPDWVQDWRRPLRRALNYLKYYVDEHFFRAGPTVFQNAGQALRDYGLVLAQGESLPDFLARHCLPEASVRKKATACQLLAMQKLTLTSFSSCAWFFDDIARIEPLNALAAARRALDLLARTQGPDIEAGFIKILAEAQSNMHDDWDGARIWTTMTAARRPLLAELAAYVTGPEATARTWNWPGVSLALSEDGHTVHAHWPGILEEESAPVPTQPAPLSPAHKAERAFLRSRILEDEIFVAQCQAAASLRPLLSGFSEGQSQPQGFLDALIPGLLWNWLLGGDELPQDILIWIPGWLGRNADLRTMLERRIEAHGRELAKDLETHEQKLLGLITRTRRVGLGVWWWEVQNTVMALADHHRHVELCQLLGLATSPG